MAEQQAVLSYDDLMRKTAAFDDAIKEIDKLEARLKEFMKTLRQQQINPNDLKGIVELINQTTTLEKAQRSLNQQRVKAVKARKQLKDLTDEELIQREKQRAANRERLKIAKLQAVITNQQAGDIKKLRAELSLISIQWANLTDREGKNADEAKELSARKLQLTTTLEKLERATGDARRGVGKYERALNGLNIVATQSTARLGGLGRVAARLFIGSTLVNGLRRITAFFGDLIAENRAANQEIDRLGSAIEGASRKVRGVATRALAFFAPLVTSVVNGFSSLLGVIFDVSEAAEEFSATSEGLAQVTEGLTSEFNKESAQVNQVFASLKNANKGSAERKALIDRINNQYGKYLPNLLTEKSSLLDIERAQRLVNEQLSKNFQLKIQQATQSDIFVNKITEQNAAFQAFREQLERAGVSVDASLNPAFNELLDKLNDVDGVGELASRSFKRFEFNQDELIEKIAETNPSLAKLVGLIDDYRASLGNFDLFDAFIENLESSARKTDKYNRAANETNAIISELTSGLESNTVAITSNAAAVSSATQSEFVSNIEQRISAIESLQLQLEKSEAESAEIRQERLLRLEDLRFKAERKQREQNFISLVALIEDEEQALIDVFGKNSKEVLTFREQAAKEIRELEAINYQLEQEQLAESERKKREIRQKFALSTTEIEPIDPNAELFSQALKSTQDAVNKDQQKRLENTAKQKEAIKSLLNEVVSITEQINQRIGDVFQRQVDFTARAVEQQAQAVSRAEDRARQGLSNTLKFEQEQLAASQAAQVRAERRKQQQEKITALFSLVSAKAQEGDPNATLKEIAEFTLLEALSSAIQGSFYEGTEDTGRSANPIDSKGGMLSILHPHERVLTRAQNDQLVGMSNSDVVEYATLGKALAHNADAISTKGGHVPDFSGLEREVKLLRKDFKQLAQRPTIMDHQVAIRNGIEHRVRETVTAGMKKLEKHTKGL